MFFVFFNSVLSIFTFGLVCDMVMNARRGQKPNGCRSWSLVVSIRILIRYAMHGRLLISGG